MKRVLTVLLALNLALLAGWLVREVTAGSGSEGGGAGVDIVNGDTNGDGERDISDAVHLLNWLFSGGREPVACAGSDLEARVAALESIVRSCFPDQNGDGVPDCAQANVDADGDGFTVLDDCDDSDADVNPGVPEICGNNIDDDCDGALDIGDSQFANDPQNCGDCGAVCPPGMGCVNGHCVAADNDGDGFSPPQDCDDNDARVFPGAPEVCNSRDDDCDGTIDEGFNLATDPQNCGACGLVCPPGSSCVGGQCRSADNDGDGFSPPQDCNDNDARVNPAAPEACNSRDDDCDGTIDEGFNLATDPRNCGACGVVCPQGTFCVNGQCVQP
jgi:hypothetical protein